MIIIIYILGIIVSLYVCKWLEKKYDIDLTTDYDDLVDSNAQAFLVFSIFWPIGAIIGFLFGLYKCSIWFVKNIVGIKK